LPQAGLATVTAFWPNCSAVGDDGEAEAVSAHTSGQHAAGRIPDVWDADGRAGLRPGRHASQ